MIVRNEERHLARCLSSVQSIVEEIVIVDTGSTDNTVSIAKSFGAQVFKVAWEHDFSAARNLALSKCTQPWILVLDADETWDSMNNKDLSSLLQGEAVGYYVNIRNYIGPSLNKQSYTTDYTCRLFRRDERIQFNGYIHEQVITSITKHFLDNELLFTSLLIHHFGYVDDAASYEKHQRNMSLLMKQYDLNPTDSYTLYAIGTEYFQQENYDEALTWYERCHLSILKTDGFYLDFLYKYSYSLYEVKRHKEVLTLLLSLEHDQKIASPDLLELQGFIYLENQQFQQASNAFQDCINMCTIHPYPSLYAGTGTFQTFFLQGIAYTRLLQFQEAEECFFRSFAFNNENTSALLNWLRISLLLWPQANGWLEAFTKRFKVLTDNHAKILLYELALWHKHEQGLLFLSAIPHLGRITPFLHSVLHVQNGDYPRALYLLKRIEHEKRAILMKKCLANEKVTKKDTDFLGIKRNDFFSLLNQWSFVDQSIGSMTHLYPSLYDAPLSFLQQLKATKDATYEQQVLQLWIRGVQQEKQQARQQFYQLQKMHPTRLSSLSLYTQCLQKELTPQYDWLEVTIH
ncbi:glycosyltransferase family 2 protein [Bacillus sp. CGMCC 1.16541]|uniref:glycosyltransferase n=1 Tax=Bacillus sp. CGMCC 1.16541 TaxID=2185143 RepID=UPI0023B7FB6A|nr:glycosyltransferase family 2 protein [Bacillus sp. CGMCC 1.16541]